MKRTNKYLSLALALIMALSLCVTSFAADVTISSTVNEDATYEAYKIMNLTTALTCNDEHEHETTCYAYSYTLNSKYSEEVVAAMVELTGNTFTATAEKTVDVLITEAMAEFELAAEARELAEALYDAVKGLDADAELTANTKDTLEQGYWIIVDTTNMGTGDEGDHHSLIMLDTAGQQEITIAAKDETITVTKSVDDNCTHIGDTVTFTLTSSLAVDLDKYESYTFKFVDTMDDGLTYAGNVELIIDGTEVNAENVIVTTEGVNRIFDITTYVNANKETLGGKSVVVKYDATLNANAVGAVKENNQVYVVFSDDTTDTTSTNTTIVATADVITYDASVTKYTGKVENTLSGAKFIIWREVDGVKNYAVTTPISNGIYTMTDWTTDKDQATTFISQDNGKFVIHGLEADTYKLEETEAPEGYNLLASPVDLAVGTESANASINVENKSGALLPSTGGVGTTMFYVIGAVMMIGAAILLVTKKKMANEQ